MVVLASISVALGIAGTAMNAFKLRAGFILWLISNFIQIYIAQKTGVTPNMIMFSVYSGFAIFGYFNWGKKKP